MAVHVYMSSRSLHVVDDLRCWINSTWTVRRKGIQKPVTLEHLGSLSFNFLAQLCSSFLGVC